MDFEGVAVALPEEPAPGDLARVPAHPSAISEFQSNFSEILNGLREINFGALSREAQQILVETNRQLSRSDLPALAAQWERTGAAFESLARSPDVESMLRRLNEASLRIVETLATLDRHVGITGGEVQDTLREVQTTLATFNEAAASIQGFVQAQSGLGDDVSSALRQLTDALASVQRLAEYLERNPNALIYGRRPE
jgi:paraquat-inducible protein B